MPACSDPSLRFAKVTCISVDCQFRVAYGVCDYCVLLCRDLIQQLVCLPHFSSVGVVDFDDMALIRHSSVLSIALPKNKNFHRPVE